MSKRKLTALKWAIILCSVLIIYGILLALAFLKWHFHTGYAAIISCIVTAASAIGIPKLVGKLVSYLMRNTGIDDDTRGKYNRSIDLSVFLITVIIYVVLYIFIKRSSGNEWS